MTLASTTEISAPCDAMKGFKLWCKVLIWVKNRENLVILVIVANVGVSKCAQELVEFNCDGPRAVALGVCKRTPKKLKKRPKMAFLSPFDCKNYPKWADIIIKLDMEIVFRNILQLMKKFEKIFVP